MTPPPRDHDASGGAPTLAEQLRAAADLVEVDPTDVPDATKRDRLLTLCRTSGQLYAALAREAGVFDTNTVWAGDGKKTTASWMTSRSEISPSHARAVVHIAKAIRPCPVVDAAWTSGRIGTAKVTALVTAQRVNPDLFAHCETALVDDVEPMTVTAAERHIAQWAAIAEATRDAQAAEDAGEDPDNIPVEDPMAQNSLHLSQTLGGRWISDANYDPVTGAERHSAIQARIDAKFRNGTYHPDDGMTPAQRRAECDHEIFMAGTDPTQTKHGQARPSVSVEIDARTLAGLPILDAADAATRTCQLDNGTPIARSTIDRLLCTSHLTTIATKMALDGTIEVIGITDILRDATPAQRRALKQRDGGCVFTGCTAPFQWCDAHHLWQHDAYGPTLLDNLVLLCKHHHHLVHEGGWHLWRDQQRGQLYLNKPDGTPVPVIHHGLKVPQGNPPPQPPPPLRRNGPPRYLTRAELAELEHRKHQRGTPG